MIHSIAQVTQPAAAPPRMTKPCVNQRYYLYIYPLILYSNYIMFILQLVTVLRVGTLKILRKVEVSLENL